MWEGGSEGEKQGRVDVLSGMTQTACERQPAYPRAFCGKVQRGHAREVVWRKTGDTPGWREDGSGQGLVLRGGGAGGNTDQPRLCAGRDDGGAATGDRHFM